MSSFLPTMVIPSPAEPDPAKHVNFVPGMVLGADDFNQEFAYLAERDRFLARELSGYGVTRGLGVSIAAGWAPGLVVAAGAAISPRGHVVRVSQAESANLDDWIDANREAIVKVFGAAPAEGEEKRIAAYVVLSYRALATDLVPVPGEAGRSEKDVVAHSRVADGHALELRLVAPEQREDDAVRDLAAWLGAVELVPKGGASLADFLGALRTAAKDAVAPAFLKQPPEVKVSYADAPAFFRSALRLFVTTLRVSKLGEGQTAAGAPPREDALLLAKVEIDTVGGKDGAWAVAPSPSASVQIIEDRRPFLVPGQMLEDALATTLERAARLRQAVAHPYVTPAYSYVVLAAGIVKVVAGPALPEANAVTTNAPVAWSSGAGEITVAIRKPDFADARYVVKALPFAAGASIPVVGFAGFEADAGATALRFKLRVSSAGGAEISAESLVGLELMIEVSGYVKP